MEKKGPVFLFFGVLVCLFVVSATTTSGHVVSPGAVVRGVVSNQPDSAKLNAKGIALVETAEIRLIPIHDSIVTGIAFTLEGNANAIAILEMDDGEGRYREVASLKLNGKSQHFGLERRVFLPKKPTFFVLKIGYKGAEGESVRKVKVTALPEEIVIYSPGHGGVQEIDVAIDFIAWPGKKETITLE